MNDIIDTIGLPAVLEQLAEECSELAQASLKYARLLRGENPTPKTEAECLESLTEEMADVELCNSILMIAGHVNSDTVMDTIDVKERRWHERLEKAEEKPSAQPDTTTHDSIPAKTGKNDGDGTSGDCINRQAAIGITKNVVNTNPEHFEAHQKFIKFMDDKDISSFGKWQWANGFNTALVATTIQLKKLPSIQPERKTGHWIYGEDDGQDGWYCSECNGFVPWDYEYYGLENIDFIDDFKVCPFCEADMVSRTGADMRGEAE